VAYGDDGVDRARCRNRVVVAYGDRLRGTCDRVEVDDGGFRLVGHVRLWTEAGLLTGDRLTIRVDARRLQLEGQPTRWRTGAPVPELPRDCPP